MSKSKKLKFYAVRNGRKGARIYTSWDETKEDVSRWPGAVHKSFTSLSQAQDWLSAAPSAPDVDMEIIQEDGLSPHAQNLSTCTSRVATPSSSNLLSSKVAPNSEQDSVQENIVLSREQLEVLEMVKNGENVFFTGSAGTGKSVLLREIIEFCGGRSCPTLAVTAATGIASVNIGGSTLHSWAGIGLGKESADKLVGKLLGKDKHQRQNERHHEMKLQAQDHLPSVYTAGDAPRIVQRWRDVQTLIIDEISMIDGILFDKLEYIARVLRRSDAPFGGIQLVLSGDFCQLPPVPDRETSISQATTFAFDARTWTQCIGRPVVLHRVFRQKDQAFVDMLNSMRFGHLSPETVQEFRKLSRPVVYNDGIEPTDLFPTRREVDAANNLRLSKLGGDSHVYKSHDVPGYDATGMMYPMAKVQGLLERLIAPQVITLKVGAQVMLIKNLVQGELVNGSVGRVIGFSTSRDAIKHGTDIARTETEAGKGDADEKRIPDHILNDDRSWPIVEFSGRRTKLCIPTHFEVNNADGLVEARRDQIPLILAWALSIHKSQGQTLERVRVNLGRIFEKGQAYVALSRATSMETLQVLGFDPARVMAHPRVLAWMSEVTGQEYRTQEEIDDDAEYWDLYS